MSEWDYTIAQSGDDAEPEAPFDLEAAIARYQSAAIALLPPGIAWPKEPDSKLGRLLEALSVEPARIDEDATALLRGADPRRMDEGYAQLWEEALALPGSCVSTPSTDLDERRGAVITKLRGRRSHAQATFDLAAADLGYTDLEYERFPSFTVGSSSVGGPLYGDEWAHVVRVSVPVGDQTADEQLVCTFTDELRRAHGFIDVILEGPMGATRTHTQNYLNDHTMSADFILGDVAPIEIKYSGFLSIQMIIDNGAGAAPTDTPVGVWQLWVSSDGGSTYSRWVTTAVTNELALIAPNGNNVVSALAVFENVPGQYAKLLYDRTSGGGTDARATAHVTAW